MIEWWWLIPAVFAAVVVGYFAAIMCVMASRSDQWRDK